MLHFDFHRLSHAIYLAALFFCLFIPFAWTQETETGILIVTYQTGPKAERLDRVRFILKQEDNRTEMYPKGDSYLDDPICRSRMVVIENLPVGNYSLQFVVPNIDKLFNDIPPRQVQIEANRASKVDQVIKPRYATLKAHATLNPDKPGEYPVLTLKNEQGQIRAQSTIGKFSVKHLLPGSYQLVFEEITGYKAPAPMNVQLGPNEILGPIQEIYSKIDVYSANVNKKENEQDILNEIEQKTVLVPEGKVIMGDSFQDNLQNELKAKIVKISSFSIGVYEVTNSQYALWLTRAFKENKVVYHASGDYQGYVTNPQGLIYCRTQEADPHSQITAQVTKSNSIFFLPVLGKHNFPVINISWYGAQAFCKDNQLRLPTEAEWEKSAGMAITPIGAPLKKYRYGFEQNVIDRRWANYKAADQDADSLEVRTTRVGFYNGINKLPKLSTDKEALKTHLALSPAGAYDMSGNVWEWVSDWHDDSYYQNMPEINPQGPAKGTKKVAKGGCYDSLAAGVRVAERMGLPPDHTDIYTGFRVASD